MALSIIVFLLFFRWGNAVAFTGSVRPWLDPGRITWWRNQWMGSPVSLSVNNALQSGVTATFFFSPTTSLTNGVLEVSFPVGFSVSRSGNRVVQVPSQTYIGGQDYQVSIPGVTNPGVTGGYGLFALKTRLNPTGQQIDANLAFGSVYIEPVATAFSSLLVQLTGANLNNVINKNGNSLAFKFTLGVSLWRYDTFLISIDKYWTVSSPPICVSVPYPNTVDNFNGTDSSNTHKLSCMSTVKVSGQSQQVYIYGLSVSGIDVSDLDNQSVNIQVTSATTPNVAYFNNYFFWTVSTLRFGSNTVLQTGVYNNGPGIAPDVINSVTWTPTWGLETWKLAYGMVVFMDLSFVTTSPIPAGGSVVVVVSEDVCSNAWGSGTDIVDSPGVNCYVVNYLGDGITCTTSSISTITIQNLPFLPPSQQFTIRNLVKIVSQAGVVAQVLSVNSYDSAGGINIDTVSNMAAFVVSVGSFSVLATQFSVRFQNSLGTVNMNQAGGSGNLGLVLAFGIKPMNSGTQFLATSVVTIGCPLAAKQDDFRIFIPSGNRKDVWTTTGPSFAVSTQFNYQGNRANGSPVTIVSNSTGLGSITWTAGSNLLVPSLWIGHFLTSGSSFISLPHIASNAATAYECYLTIEDKGPYPEKTPQVQVAQFSIAPQPWNPVSSSFSLLCSNNVDGAPAQITIQPKVVDFFSSSETKTYFLELQFTIGTATGNTAQGFSSGLKSGDPYPHAHVLGVETSANLVYSSTRNYIRIQGFGLISASTGTPATVYFPISGVVIGAHLQPYFRSYYILTEDPRYRYVTHETLALTYTTTSTSSATFKAASYTISPNPPLISGELGPDLTLTLKQSAIVTTTTQWVYFLFPQGYSWTSAKQVSSSLPTPWTVFPTQFFFSSPSDSFMHPGVLVQSVLGNARVDYLAPSKVKISGYRLPSGKPSYVPTLGVVTGSLDGNLASACGNTDFTSFSLVATPGTIATLGISPNSVPSRGPDGINIKHALDFSLQHGLDAGGFIILSIESDWSTTPCTVCSLSGLQDSSPSHPITCGCTGNTVTVTQFADFSGNKEYTVVTLVLEHLLPPDTTSVQTYNFVASIETRTSLSTGYQLVDQYVPSSTAQVTVSPSSQIGAPVWEAKQLVPDAAELTNVDLYLRFSLPHALPACGTISIAGMQIWKFPDGDVKDFCYLSPIQYQSCIRSGAELQITLNTDAAAGTVYELYLDSALDSPFSIQTGSSAFLISSYWFTVTVDTDGASITVIQSPTAQGMAPATIIPISLQVTPTNAGEAAEYVFAFLDPVDFFQTDTYWIQFPPEFDYFVGNAQKVYGEDQIYSIPCSSPLLWKLTCRVSHSIVVITSSSFLLAPQPLNLTLSGVLNPSVSMTNFFSLYHIDSLGLCVSAQQEFNNVWLSNFPVKIDVRSIETSNPIRGQLSNYTWSLYIQDIISLNTSIQVDFPGFFSMETTSGNASFPCVCSIVNSAVNSPQDVAWNPMTNCPISGMTVSLPPPTLPKTLSPTSLVVWTVFNVTNPVQGWLRVSISQTSDFDVWAEDVWPSYQFWTEKFGFSVLTTTNSGVFRTSRSYGNLNAAYLGFSDSKKPIYIQSTSGPGSISIYAGTQSTDIPIFTRSQTQPCSAKSLLLSPNTSPLTPDMGKIRYSSYPDIALFQGFWIIYFRVAAAGDLPKGEYKVDWTLQETVQTGVIESQYDPPISMKIVVYPLNATNTPVSVQQIPSLQPGAQTPPIKVGVENAPYSDMTVNVYVGNAPRYVSVQPAALQFLPDVNERYFQVLVNPKFKPNPPMNVFQLVFSLSGTDAGAYSIVPTLNFTIEESFPVANGTILTLGLSSPTRTTISATPVVDSPGVLYWFLAVQGTGIPTFPQVKNSTNSLLNGPGKTSAYYASQAPERLISDPTGKTTWVTFQKSLYKAHLGSTWVGSISVSSPDIPQTLNFTWLWADTTYNLAVYLDQLISDSSEVPMRVETFTTVSISSPQPLRVQFLGHVVAAWIPKIAYLAAQYQGVNPSRLYNGTLEITSSGDTYYTCFCYTLLPNRFTEGPEPESQAMLIGEQFNDFQSDVYNTLGIVNVLEAVTNDPKTFRSYPQWSCVPQAGGSTNNTVTVYLRSSIPGFSCCAALFHPYLSPTSTQIFLGVNATNFPVPQTCITSNVTNATNKVKIGGLQADTDYEVFCTVTDDYPLWSTVMQDSLRAVQVRTQAYNVTELLPITTFALSTVLMTLWTLL